MLTKYMRSSTWGGPKYCMAELTPLRAQFRVVPNLADIALTWLDLANTSSTPPQRYRTKSDEIPEAAKSGERSSLRPNPAQRSPTLAGIRHTHLDLSRPSVGDARPGFDELRGDLALAQKGATRCAVSCRPTMPDKTQHATCQHILRDSFRNDDDPIATVATCRRRIAEPSPGADAHP